MSKRVGIFGISGMAREARDIAIEIGLHPIFVVTKNDESVNYAGSEEVISESDIGRFKDIPYVIGIGSSKARKDISMRYENELNFCNLIHPNATFGLYQRREIEGKRGVIICSGVRFTSNIKVGNFTIFNINSTISHDSIIEDFVTISPQACILGNVEVREGAWIGAGAVINQGANSMRRIIGAETVIGSGSVILRDCDSNSIYAGVPARKLR